MLAFPLIQLRSSALPRGPGFLRPGFLPGLRGQILVRGARPGSKAKRKQQLKFMLARRACVTSGHRHVVRCADDVTYIVVAALPAVALAPLPCPARKSCCTGPFELQAGSRVEGTRGPSGAPRSGAKRRGKRACPSTGTCELRSGLRFVSTAGNRTRRMRGRRGRGVGFSWLLLFGHPTIQREVTRPTGRNAVALESTATSDQRPATSEKRQAISDKRQATSDKRQATSKDRGQSPLPQQPEAISDHRHAAKRSLTMAPAATRYARAPRLPRL